MDALADAAVDGLAAQDAAVKVDDLQGGFALVGDDPTAVEEEGEAVIVAIIVVVGVPANEHEAEAAFIVRHLGVEGVRRRLQQVNIRTSEVINQVEVMEV